jgi:hypothetical protein
MDIERSQPIRQYQKEDKPCIVLAHTYSSFLEWTKSQEEDIAKVSIYCASTPVTIKRRLLNKSPAYYILVVLPDWYLPNRNLIKEAYSVLTQLGFQNEALTEVNNYLEEKDNA